MPGCRPDLDGGEREEIANKFVIVAKQTLF